MVGYDPFITGYRPENNTFFDSRVGFFVVFPNTSKIILHSTPKPCSNYSGPDIKPREIQLQSFAIPNPKTLNPKP